MLEVRDYIDIHHLISSILYSMALGGIWVSRSTVDHVVLLLLTHLLAHLVDLVAQVVRTVFYHLRALSHGSGRMKRDVSPSIEIILV